VIVETEGTCVWEYKVVGFWLRLVRLIDGGHYWNHFTIDQISGGSGL
jgi:hypothetical protein